jgi:hypothetical protein
MLATKEAALERWLGAPAVKELRQNMVGWYGPRIAVAGVPGAVWARKDGDFEGKLRIKRYSQFADYAYEKMQRVVSRWSRHVGRTAAMAGFSSLSDLISEATTNGKRLVFPFQKTGSTGVVNVTNSLWRVGASPPAGSAPAAAPGGTARDDTATGAFPFTNPAAGDTQHITVGYPTASVVANTLLLYDRLFDVLKTMASVATEAVTGVPTRYQSQTATDQTYIGGNFLFVEVGGTALAATAHNWTVCLYTDQGGASSTMPSLTGISGAIVDRLDMPVGTWFAPLEAGDVGVKALTQMQCSASVATGVINFVIGHPLAWMPCPIANLICVADGINSAFSLTRVMDDACLAFLEVNKPATTATVYAGTFETVAG